VPQSLNIHEFLKKSIKKKVIDVRSPAEFEQGHIPHAVNIPLFNNEERAAIGTLYKQKSRQAAVIKGLELVSPRMTNLVLWAKEYAHDNEIYIHCWRGGMRSGFVAMLLEMYGYKVFILKGGYKTFRTFSLESFHIKRNIIVLGGRTGSGKTKILSSLEKLGAVAIDLEKHAHHKGSAFGSLGEKPEPTQEQFENELAVALFHTKENDAIWVEDESRMIGRKVIPEGLWNQMRNTLTYYISLPFEERLNYIVREYGKFTKEELSNSILKISKRLGPEQTKNSLLALEIGDTKTAFEYCLHYYDKSYGHGLSQREQSLVKTLVYNELDPDEIAKSLLSTNGTN
jgi:tRNA 2-selenouridine synthase